MNDKDKDAFEQHINVVCNQENDYQRFYAIWQSACEYKQKEINELNKAVEFFASENTHYFESLEKLQAENAKMRECIEWYADKRNCDNADFAHVEIDNSGEEIADGGYRARKVLKELKDK